MGTLGKTPASVRLTPPPARANAKRARSIPGLTSEMAPRSGTQPEKQSEEDDEDEDAGEEEEGEEEEGEGESEEEGEESEGDEEGDEEEDEGESEEGEELAIDQDTRRIIVGGTVNYATRVFDETLIGDVVRL